MSTPRGTFDTFSTEDIKQSLKNTAERAKTQCCVSSLVPMVAACGISRRNFILRYCKRKETDAVSLTKRLVMKQHSIY